MAHTVTAVAPGRANLIGEHTDYNDGLALPFAIEQGVTVRARAQAGGVVRSRPPAPAAEAFLRGAVAELRATAVALGGAEVSISGELPRGAGLGSSAALSVALALALSELGGAPAWDLLELARLCSRVESEWVGARTGLLDQLASLFGQAGHALLIDFSSLTIEPVPLELGGHRLVVIDSGQRHQHAASGYNERRQECARACSLLGVESLRAADADAIKRLPTPLRERARHVAGENERVRAAVAALHHGDLGALGELIDRSHASLRDDYAVSTDAVEATVRRVKRAGALGARIMGGGFGGSVIALLPEDAPRLDGALELRAAPGARVLRAP